MKAVLIVAMLLAFGFTSSVQPQPTTDEGFCKSYAKSDVQLNKIYQKILVEYRQDKLFITKLRSAQRAWIAFTDAHIESTYPLPNAYGSVNKMCRCQVMNELIEARIQQLKKWVDGFEEGEVCTGSVKIKESK
jgi:uncharacterized protein YecT (DUF1311 family)